MNRWVHRHIKNIKQGKRDCVIIDSLCAHIERQIETDR